MPRAKARCACGRVALYDRLCGVCRHALACSGMAYRNRRRDGAQPKEFLADPVRAERVGLYAARAALGLPLFEVSA